MGKDCTQPGRLILYGQASVCRVEGVVEWTLPGEKGPIPFCLLRPLYQNGTISAPVEKVEDRTIFSRALMNWKQAQELIEVLPALPAVHTTARI